MTMQFYGLKDFKIQFYNSLRNTQYQHFVFNSQPCTSIIHGNILHRNANERFFLKRFMLNNNFSVYLSIFTKNKSQHSVSQHTQGNNLFIRKIEKRKTVQKGALVSRDEVDLSYRTPYCKAIGLRWLQSICIQLSSFEVTPHINKQTRRWPKCYSTHLAASLTCPGKLQASCSFEK